MKQPKPKPKLWFTTFGTHKNQKEHHRKGSKDRFIKLSFSLALALLFPLVILAQDIYNFAYTGGVQTFTVPANGKYRLEAWGAQGGTGESYTVSKGGYAKGEVYLTAGTTIYIYVGGQGNYMTYGGSSHSTAVSRNGGWNGGGGVYNSRASFGTGGGATDFCLTSSAMSLNDYAYKRTTASYLSRILVAGGAGGNGNWVTRDISGGGETGIGNEPGRQSSAGANGAFGFGGKGAGGSGGGSGGGGGWYGGGMSIGGGNNGGGGSSYVLTAASYKPSGYTPDASYHMTATNTIAGNATMPNPSGGTMTGRTGHGYARITELYFAEITQTAALIACNNLNNAALSVSVTGGDAPYTYSWSPNVSSSATASNLAPGTYPVTVTDSSSKVTTSSFTVVRPNAITATTSKVDINCTGTGSATVNPSGGTGAYTYSWSP
ncbi:MAG: glycine-rich protein, partial [Flavobacteriaceae bacterium]|nr:glycine-rich protein [Flavobacteriaceae bacterium]